MHCITLTGVQHPESFPMLHSDRNQSWKAPNMAFDLNAHYKIPFELVGKARRALTQELA